MAPQWSDAVCRSQNRAILRWPTPAIMVGKYPCVSWESLIMACDELARCCVAKLGVVDPSDLALSGASNSGSPAVAFPSSQCAVRRILGIPRGKPRPGRGLSHTKRGAPLGLARHPGSTHVAWDPGSGCSEPGRRLDWHRSGLDHAHCPLGGWHIACLLEYGKHTARISANVGRRPL